MEEKQPAIPDQVSIPWNVALAVSWSGIRRRLFRSFITMLGIVLAVALVTYMLLTDALTTALIEANNDALNTLLQKAGVDIFGQHRMTRMMMLLIGLSLFTSLVGIINSMLMSVTERVREIGTLKCLGALDTFILKTYFIESSLQGIVGTFTGVILGSLVAIAVSAGSYGMYVFRYFPVSESFRSLLIAGALGVLIAVVASIAPAYWAARKEPVEAMRVEE